MSQELPSAIGGASWSFNLKHGNNGSNQWCNFCPKTPFKNAFCRAKRSPNSPQKTWYINLSKRSRPPSIKNGIKSLKKANICNCLRLDPGNGSRPLKAARKDSKSWCQVFKDLSRAWSSSRCLLIIFSSFSATLIIQAAKPSPSNAPWACCSWSWISLGKLSWDREAAKIRWTDVATRVSTSYQYANQQHSSSTRLVDVNSAHHMHRMINSHSSSKHKETMDISWPWWVDPCSSSCSLYRNPSAAKSERWHQAKTCIAGKRFSSQRCTSECKTRATTSGKPNRCATYWQ